MSNEDVKKWIVLVVDDEPDNIGVVEMILSFHGATIHTAPNGVEGLRCLEVINPTVILMDLSMPEMDGWEMFKRVRANPKTAPIPIIALTAHALPDDLARIEATGFDAYILKPLRLATFLLEIRKCLEAAQQEKTNQ